MTPTVATPWIRSRGFDLGFLTLSAVLVFLPYVSYGFLQKMGLSIATSSLVVGLSVTVLVGGPHMYSTYLRTALEPRFRHRYGWLAYLPLVPRHPGIALRLPGAPDGFFFWDSVDAHQARIHLQAYRRKYQEVSNFDRLLDAAVILGSLYTMAMFKFVRGEFVIGSQPLLFPKFLRFGELPYVFAVGFAALFAFYVVRTAGEIRRGVAGWPRLLFMALTISMAFIVPLFDNLDVSFQGFNTWHSLQYLALTWFILDGKAQRGDGSAFVEKISGRAKTPATTRRRSASRSAPG
jgi:hypothetical protein